MLEKIIIKNLAIINMIYITEILLIHNNQKIALNMIKTINRLILT